MSSEYQQFRRDLARRIREHEPVFGGDFARLTPFDQVAFDHLYRVSKREVKRETAEPLNVVRQTHGIQVVDGVFSPIDPPDDFYYHITRQRALSKILWGGFAPAQGVRLQTSRGMHRAYAMDKVFFCDRGGVAYWKSKIMVDVALEASKKDKALALLVLRIPKSSVMVVLIEDESGTIESSAKSWYTTSWVRGLPDEVDAEL